jgi:enoyl-[acyl-carrier-protein] reductase (NADH)
VAVTRMTEDLPMMKGIKTEELGPQFIAPVAAFLASDLASDLTGQIVGVQGAKVFLYKMIETEGATKSGGLWTPEELKARWADIAK